MTRTPVPHPSHLGLFLIHTASSCPNRNIQCLATVGSGAGLVFQVTVNGAQSPLGTDTLSYPTPVVVQGTIRGALTDALGATVYTPPGNSLNGGIVFFNVRFLPAGASPLAVTYMLLLNGVPAA